MGDGVDAGIPSLSIGDDDVAGDASPRTVLSSPLIKLGDQFYNNARDGSIQGNSVCPAGFGIPATAWALAIVSSRCSSVPTAWVAAKSVR